MVISLMILVLLTGILHLAWKTKEIFTTRYEPGLEDLPGELLQTILTMVGNRSLCDLVRCKKTCRTLRTVVDSPVYQSGVDMWIMDTPNNYLNAIRDFCFSCLEYGNPSAIFLHGVARFFRRGELGGLAKIRLEAERGYPLAIYCFANIIQILNPDVEIGGPIMNPTSQLVRAERAKIQETYPGAWRYGPSFIFTEMSATIDVLEIYKCRCAQNRSWPRPWDERIKKGEPCKSCFWKIHTLWFSREFMKRTLEWPQ